MLKKDLFALHVGAQSWDMGACFSSFYDLKDTVDTTHMMVDLPSCYFEETGY